MFPLTRPYSLPVRSLEEAAEGEGSEGEDEGSGGEGQGSEDQRSDGEEAEETEVLSPPHCTLPSTPCLPLPYLSPFTSDIAPLPPPPSSPLPLHLQL